MNVGICTVHYAHNYGAMLQGYALKTYLEGLGHSVTMIDRRKNSLTKWNPKPISGLSIKAVLLYPKYLYKWYLPVFLTKKRRENRFESFLKKYLNNTSFDVNQRFDVIIYGSDQIWSKYNSGFDDVWWGMKNSNTSKRISYAASMGVLNIKDEDENYIKNALSRFARISVREENLQDELTKRGWAPHTQIERIIDPTFLLDKTDWIKLNNKRLVQDPYLLFYDFQRDTKTTEIARTIADRKGLRLIRLTEGVASVEKDSDYFVTAGPLEFVSLFYFADFVVSSSFHGAAFSIINRKQFYVRQIWNTERVKTLLDTFGLSNRFIDDVKGIDLNDEINYDRVNLLLTTKRKEAVDFLKKSLYE